jgi:hypothetical protein
VIWLAWRQFRAQGAVLIGALVVIGAMLLLTGPPLVHLYDATVATCAAHGDCATVIGNFSHRDFLVQQVAIVLLVAPVLVGMFLGAPLVARELEHKTNQLAWTQGVSRTRWLATKLVLVGAACMACAGILSLMVTWWFSPIDRANMISPLSASLFDRRDIVPIGYTAFAFVLGVAAGLLIRRTLPAMAATLVAFIGTRLAVFDWVRPRLSAPLTVTSPFESHLGLPNSVWVLSDQTINRAGSVIGQNGGIGNMGLDFGVSNNGTLTLRGVGTCPNKAPLSSFNPGQGLRFGSPSPAFVRATNACVNKLGIRDLVRYQPVSRYWSFQWYEMAIFIGLAVILAAGCLWWVSRGLS